MVQGSRHTPPAVLRICGREFAAFGAPVAGRDGREAVQSARRREEANDTAVSGVSLASLGLGVGFGFEVLDGLCLCIFIFILFLFQARVEIPDAANIKLI
jgi:hypothetical protein